MYCLILLHNTVPHHHCADTVTDAAQSTHHEDHHHPGHEHHSESDSENIFGFFLDFLGGLDHQDDSDGELTWFIGEDAKLQLNAFDMFPLVAVLSANLFVLTEDPRIAHLSGLPPPQLPQVRYQVPPPLRGPPSIS